MKEIKIKYWHFLLFVFIVVYLGAFLFFRSTVDSRLGFYGDIINAFGTIIGVIVAYYIMRIQIHVEQNNAKKDEERANVLEIEKELKKVQRSRLSGDLKLIKTYSTIYNNDKEFNIAKRFIEKRKNDDSMEQNYDEIDDYMMNIKLAGGHFPLENDLLGSCKRLYKEWNEFHIKLYILFFSEDVLNGIDSEIADINNLEMTNQANKLLNEIETITQKIDEFFQKSRNIN